MTLRRVVIIGASGQAREVAWYLDEINRVRPSFRLVGCVVTDLRGAPHPPDERGSLPLLGDYGWLSAHAGQVDGLVLGVGLPASRLRIAAELETAFPRLEWPPVIHPGARYDAASASVGPGVMIGPGVVGTVNLVIGPFAMLNFACTLGHEVRIGRGAVVNPGANLSGGVTVGDGALIGAGAVVLQNRSIGARASVGAGAVVTHDVAEGATVVGVPARPMMK